MIHNTAADMQDPGNAMGFALQSLADRDGGSRAIEEQEKRGQQQVVNSDRLPTQLQSPRSDFADLGFVFGDPDPRDPMFTSATLPEGWAREGSDHALWSYIVDEHGRRRASIFYKAAYYDRDAFMGLTSVSGYLRECVYEDREPIVDDTWATPAAIADAARKAAASAQESVEQWTQLGNDERIARYTAERDKWQAIADRHEAAS